MTRWIAVIPLLVAVGCAYRGTARSFDPEELRRDPGWIAVTGVPLRLQEGEEDCGVATIEMMLAFWGKNVLREQILTACPPEPGRGIRAGDLREFVRGFGLRAYLLHGEWKDFENELAVGHPVLVGLVKPYVTGPLSHYEVVVAVHPATGDVVTLDPAHGWRRNSLEGFRQEWEPAGRLTLVVFKEASASGGN